MPAGEPAGRPTRPGPPDGAGERAVPRPCRGSRGIDLAVRVDCPRLMASNDHQSHRTPRPGPPHRLADPEELDSGPDGIAGNQHGGAGGAGRDLPALQALGRADPVPGATGQPLPGFAQRSRRAGPTAAQPPALAAHPPAKTGNSWARRRSAPPPSNRRPRPEQLLLHLPARKSALAQPVNRGALLQMHQGMMPGQPQGQPGRYRSSAGLGPQPVRVDPPRRRRPRPPRFALGVTLQVTATATADRSPA